ncbi:MAG: glycosyl transferase family 2, partial [Flaviaesturariibacter sp.]|nr:glycosyl transferase family 2 [Flaviaesturariibacter sp.]
QFDLFRIIKFGVVGSLGMVVDFGLTYVCKETLRINKYLANAIGFTAAVVFNYVLNRYWTFQSNGYVPVQLARFFLVALVGLGLNTGIVYLLALRRVNFYLSKAIAVALVFFWNYSANAFFTFAR